MVDPFPTFAPVEQGEPEFKLGGLTRNAAARRPLISTIRLRTSQSGVTAAVVNPLTVGAPSLVKLLTTTTDLLTATKSAILDMFWRPRGMDALGATNSAALPKRIPFLGPYAYLPEAGEYELFGWSNTSAVAEPLSILAEVRQAISPEDFDATLNSDAAHFVVRGSTALAAAGPMQPIDVTNHQSFMQWRRIILQNAGANPIVIQFGITASNTFSLSAIAAGAGWAGATAVIETEFMGHNTILANSTAGSTLNYILSLW